MDFFKFTIFIIILSMIMLKKTGIAVLCLVLILIVPGDNLKAQNMFRKFCQLPGPEKVWVLTHPFIAHSAWKYTQSAEQVADSLKNRYADTTYCDDHWDAFRHCYWMAFLSSRLRPGAVCRLGCAHELSVLKKFTYLQDSQSCLHDSTASYMDLHNNLVGLRIGQKHSDQEHTVIAQAVFEAVARGQCRQVARDSLNRFVNEQGKPIPQKQLKKWNTGRILEPTKFQRTKK